GHRHARPQHQIAVLALIEPDDHGDTLDDFDVVAGRVLGRKQAEARSAGSRQTFDVTAIAAAVGVHLDVRRLADLHVLKLRFFEVGDNPDVVQIDNRYQELPGFDVLADLDGAPRDDSRCGRLDGGVFQI